MLTGDNRDDGRRPSPTQLGIDEVEAEVLPERKARGRRAPARARAASSPWPATASTTRRRWPPPMSASPWAPAPTSPWRAPASPSSRAISRGIVRARRLSQATMRNIRQNLFFAFVYNAAGVPIAAGVLYPVFGLLLSPDDRRRGDGAVLGQRDRQRPAPAHRPHRLGTWTTRRREWGSYPHCYVSLAQRRKNLGAPEALVMQ